MSDVTAVSAPTTGQKIAAEAIGTFVLVLFGCGSVVFASEGSAPSTVTTIALAFGLSVTVMAYAVGRISGGHFNPAVSVGAAMGGRMAWNQVPVYVLGQLGGAILGGAVLFALAHGFSGFSAEGNMGQNGFGAQSPADYAWWAALVLEVVLTALFVMVILGVTDARNEHPAFAPLVIGLTLAAIHFVAIPADGTSVNPARSIGPAIFAGTDAVVQLWLFVLAPLVGGAVAGVVYPLLFGHGSDPVVGSGLRFGAPAVAVPGYGAPDQYQQQWNQQQDAWTAAGWTPEQIAAWEAQQGLPAQSAPSWTPEEIAAWQAQQQAQQSAHQAGQQAQPQWTAEQQAAWEAQQHQPPAQTAGGAWSDEDESERTQIRPPE